MRPGELRDAIALATGVDPTAVTAVEPVGGGDVSRAVTAVVAGQRCFVKYLDPPVPHLLAAEAQGLRWLAAADALRVPRVLGVHDDGEDPPPVLVLEHLAPARPAADHDVRLGRGLARLHRAGSGGFGAPWLGFVGPLPQPNDAAESWAAFLAERRLRPTALIADARGALPDGTLPRLDRMLGHLEQLVGPPEPPARLHGDLWSGNVMTDSAGRPVLVDPTAFGGHREIDLAMMQLFGGFGPRVLAAYDELHPRSEGHAQRTELYQLHPLLVHAALFGGGYGRRARAVIDRYA